MANQPSKLFILGSVMLLWAPLLLAQAPDTLWTRSYGGPHNDWGWSVQLTSDSGYIVAGTYGLGWLPSGGEVYLVRTNSLGTAIWTRRYCAEGKDTNYGFSVQQTHDGGYIVVGMTELWAQVPSDVYLMKMDVNGDTIWTRTYGGIHHDLGYSVQQTPDSGYIIAGGTESFDSGGDVYLIRTDANGNMLWTKTYGGDNDDCAYSLQTTSDGGYIIAGSTCSFGSGGDDVYLIKTDAKGDTLWTRTYGGTDCDVGFSVHRTLDDGCIIVGWTESFGADGSRTYLIKTDTNGDTIWTKIYQGIGYSVQQTSDGGYIVAGDYAGNVYLMKTDPNGDTLWTGTYGRGQSRSVRQTYDGGYILTGASDGNVYLMKTTVETEIREEHPLPITFFISQNMPNPFVKKTFIKYQLRQSSHVHISIYNLLGQQIRTLVNRRQNRGFHTVVWDARDNSGRRVSSGPYFLRLHAHTGLGTHPYGSVTHTGQTGKYSATRKLSVVR